MKPIGASFADELKAAGLLGLPFSWGTDGAIEFAEGMSQEQRAAVLAVYEAHDPVVGARLAAWQKIRAERDRRTHEGGYTAAGKWFHSDEFSRTQQLGLVLLGNNIPQGTLWKTMDGSFVTMTATLAQQVFAAAAASDIAIFAAAEAHRAAMEQAEDPAAYDYSGGWPAAFGE